MVRRKIEARPLPVEPVFQRSYSEEMRRTGGRPLASQLPDLPETPEGLLAARIRRLRVDRGWSQADLAARVGDGWHQTTVAKTERAEREPRFLELLRLADAFAVPVEELMGVLPEKGDAALRAAVQALELERHMLELRLQHLDEDLDALEAKRRAARHRLAATKKELTAIRRTQQ